MEGQKIEFILDHATFQMVVDLVGKQPLEEVINLYKRLEKLQRVPAPEEDEPENAPPAKTPNKAETIDQARVRAADEASQKKP